MNFILTGLNYVFWRIGLVYSRYTYNKHVEYINKIVKRYNNEYYNKDNRCCICFEDYDNGVIIEICIRCDKIYHKDCLYKWLNIDLSCPNCRKFIEKKIK